MPLVLNDELFDAQFVRALACANQSGAELAKVARPSTDGSTTGSTACWRRAEPG